MNITSLCATVAQIREDAAVVRRSGAVGHAGALEYAANEFERCIKEWQLEALTLEEAVVESGYSYSALQQKVAKKELANAGGKGAPRIRRCDLPKRGGPPIRLMTDSNGPDLAGSILKSRVS